MRVVVAAVSIVGVDENHLMTCSQGLMAVSNSKSLWNSLPSRREDAAAVGDVHRHSLTRTMKAQQLLPI